ncbi:hypothetical protein AAHA92_30837 [Salvia divinorum]|uniref:FBD domain-containing protein n=1 Tax=Salvia divinorum TaxID=28513 RepID=A0ABD1FUP9_SALDI
MDRHHRESLWVDLVNIKHLELTLDTRNPRHIDSYLKYFLRHVCRLIGACASLEKLVIKFKPSSYYSYVLETETHDEPGRGLPIKYLEITGYAGSTFDRELAFYVINNATALQKLTVKPSNKEALDRARHDFRHIIVF